MANRRCTHSEPDLRALRYDILPAARRRSCQPLRLIKQIREFGFPPFKARRVDIGDIVGNDIDIELLGAHSSGSNCETSKDLPLNANPAPLEISGDGLIPDGNGCLQRLFSRHDSLNGLLNRYPTLHG